MNSFTEIKGYVVQNHIGNGAFGDVYQATRPVIGGDVAIKVIKSEYANQPDFIRRFETEAQLIAYLDHIHIVQLYDYWRDPDGAYLVMRWLKGGNLKELLQAGPLDMDTTRLILEQIAAALAHAHRQGIIHRDLKPANILFDEDGNAYLADFGIAKDLSQPGDHTATGSFLGTVGYSAPEQIRGETISPQTDVYSLGVILYEMLTGEHPYPNLNSVEKIYKSLNDPVPLITKIQDGINEIIQMATAKDPQHRYGDPIAMVAAFREEVSGLPLSTPQSVVEALTPREQEILLLLIQNKTNREIATSLFLTVGTVKWNLSNIYKKLGVRNRVQAIVKGKELNLIVSGSKDDENLLVDHIATYLASVDVDNPYKGLRAFKLADEKDFYGRTKLTNKLIQRLNEDVPYQRFLAVLGPSGSGKSSLVQAGLLPAVLRQQPAEEAWYIVDFLPGQHPLDKLETALTRVAADQGTNIHEHLQRDERGLLRIADLILPDDDKTELLIVIDQFEEVFTLVEDEDIRTHFLNLIVAAVTEIRSRVRIVITLRADFYDRPLQYPEFGMILRERMETVLPLSAEELEAAITQPAAKLGITFEAGLVSAIVSDINYQPGALPLLQYALTELFDRRKGRAISRAAYQEIGGTIGALAKRADQVFEEFSEEGQALARQIFMRLVTLGEGTEDTRRRVSRYELQALAHDPELIDEIIDTYVSYRLLALDHDPATRIPTVEVAHEAILREWERLRTWLNDSREDIKWQRRLATATQNWLDNNQDSSFMLTGKRLQDFETWTTQTELSLTPFEQDYLETSLIEREHQEAIEVERITKEESLEKRANRILQGLVAVFLSAAIISGGLALFAFSKQTEAQENEQQAQREAEVSHSIALAASAQEALNDNDTDLAIALALEANKIKNPSAQVQRALLESAYAPGTRLVLEGHRDSVNAVALSTDGKAISGGGHPLSLEANQTVQNDIVKDIIRDFSVNIWDLSTGEVIHHLDGHEGTVWAVAFSPDNTIAVSGDDIGDVIFWDVDTGLEIERLKNRNLGSPDIRSLLFTDDGHYLFIAAENHLVFLWDMATMSVINHFEVRTKHLQYDALNQHLLTINEKDNTIDIFDINSLEAYPDPIVRESFSTGSWGISIDTQSSQYVYVGMNSPSEYLGLTDTLNLEPRFREIVLWNIEDNTKQKLYSLYGINKALLRISYEDEIVYIVNQDQVMLLDLVTGQEIYTLRGHTSTITNMDISADGNQLVTASEDGTLRLWDLRNGSELRRIYSNTGGTVVNAISNDGNLLALGGLNSTIEIWDLETNQLKHRLLSHSSSVRMVFFVERDNTLLSISRDGSIRKWDVESGTEIVSIVTGLSSWQGQVSADGQYLFVFTGSQALEWTSTKTNNIVVYDVATMNIVKTYSTRWGVMLSPEGKLAVSILPDNTAYIWNIETGLGLVDLEDSEGIAQALINFLPNGNLLIGSLDEEALAIWDIETGQIVRRFVGNSEEVTGLVLSPDGTIAVTYSNNGIVILWDVNTGEQIGRLVGEFKGGQAIELNPNGESVFIGNRDGIIMEWDIMHDPTQVLNWVHENRYIRELSCFERNFYDIEPLCELPPVPVVGGIPTQVPSPPTILTDTPLPSPTPLPAQQLVVGTAFRDRMPATQKTPDVFTFDGESGMVIMIEAGGITGTYDIELYDPLGNFVMTDGEPLALPISGSYTISVLPSPIFNGAYQILITDLSE